MISKESYYIQVNVLEALIDILDEFLEFNDKIMEFLKNSKNHKDSMYNLGVLTCGNRVSHAKYDKRFYNENKEILDKIHTHVNLFEFLCYNYGINQIKNKNILFYYNYLKDNEDNLSDISNLLSKFTKLGITDINFINDSFVNDTYEFDYTTRYGADYLENMYAVPTIIPNKLVYKTTGSNYKIFTNNKKCITINNLLFNPSLLPDVLDEGLLREILYLSNTIKEDNEVLKNAVILNVTIDDLNNQFEETNRLINSLDSIYDKKEMLNTLRRISKQIKKLELLRNGHNRAIENKIDQNNLNDEKIIYRKTRNHIDYNSK